MRHPLSFLLLMVSLFSTVHVTLATGSGFDCADVTQIPVIECEALVAIYNSTDGASWRRSDNWLTTTSLDSWAGVYISNGHITDLSLSWNMLTGIIPWQIGNLRYLKYLRMSQNNIYGTIPVEIQNLTNLRTLDLAENYLTGSIPVELGNLKKLQELYLEENYLTGTIPPQLGNLPNLVRLYLSHNRLSGVIPSELQFATALIHLLLGSNDLNGAIPPELGNLPNLGTLSLCGNELTGTIPRSLGKLVHLVSLDLCVNHLTGNIPPELSNLSNLTDLFLYGNQLSGSLPPELGLLTNLQYLFVSSNQLSGSIPLTFLKMLQLTSFDFRDTDLCESTIPYYLAWKADIRSYSGNGITCPIKPWTVLYYQAGDNDLHEMVISEATNFSGASENTDLFIPVFRDTPDRSAVYEAYADGQMIISLNQPELNTGSSFTLSEFITWAKINFPAEHYALVIVDHGHGLKGVAKDVTSNEDILDPSELRSALQDAGIFDIIYMETCLSANLELAYQVRDHALYYVASESIARGWRNHAEYLNTIRDQTTPIELAHSMAEAYYRQDNKTKDAGTISVSDITKIELVAQAANELAASIRSHTFDSGLAIWEIINSDDVQRFEENRDYRITPDDGLADLYSFASILSFLDEQDITAPATNLMHLIDEYIIYNATWSSAKMDHANAHGVSIILTKNPACYYMNTSFDFAGDVSWFCNQGSVLPTSSLENGEWGQMLSDLIAEYNPNPLPQFEPQSVFTLDKPLYYFYYYLPIVAK